MIRDRVMFNTGGSVPVGFYVAVDLADAEYVTICLTSLPHGIRFDPVLCNPANPNGRPEKKRLVAPTHLGLHLCSNFANALDSRLFGFFPVKIVPRLLAGCPDVCERFTKAATQISLKVATRFHEGSHHLGRLVSV